MKAARVRTLLFVAGILLIVWGLLPRQSVPAAAAPSLLVTETPTSEPPTSTPLPSATGFAQSPTPTNTPSPTNTPVVTDTPGPTNTPEPTEENRDRATSTPTSLPTNTPLAGIASTPVPTPPPGPGPGPDPAVSKSVSPAAAVVGDTVTYTILVTNLGGAPAAGVAVDDTLPSFLALVGVSTTRGTVATTGRNIRVEIGELAPGETVEILVTARVIAPAAAPNNRNLATVSSTSPDENPGNNQASVPVDATAPASLPNTSDAEPSLLPFLATLLGLALVASSVFLRRGARRPGRKAGS